MFIKDPKTGQQSVSLTLLIVTYVLATIAAVYMFIKTQNTSLLETQLFTFVGLYFGRKLTVNGKIMGAETTTNETLDK